MRILYVQYTNPAGYPPLEHSSHILADAGWQVRFLGTGALGADDLRFRPHPRIDVRQMAFCRPGWRQKLHYLRYCAWVLASVLTWRPRWVYASEPLSCPVAWLLTYVPGVRVVYHEHDSPDFRAAGGGGWLQWTRARLARRAVRSVLPNQARADRFERELGGPPPLCVWNCPMTEEVVEPRAPVKDGRIRVLYHGSIVPDRLPLSLLDALSRLPDTVTLRVVGYETIGSAGYVDAIRARAVALGIEHRLDIKGSVPSRSTLMALARECDLGLALVPVDDLAGADLNLAAMTGASNKPFDYLACGLALLVSDRPDWTALFVAPGYARSCVPDDPRSVEAALRWYVEHPAELRAMGEQGRRRIAGEWNYEMEFAKVREVLGDGCAGGLQAPAAPIASAASL